MNQIERKAAINALTAERFGLLQRAASLATAIEVLGGSTGGPVPASTKATGKRKAGGWPKGMKRGSRAAKVPLAATESTEAASTDSPSTPTTENNPGADSPELQAQLKAISADTTLSPIQKAQKFRAARQAHKKTVVTSTPGALAEAATA